MTPILGGDEPAPIHWSDRGGEPLTPTEIEESARMQVDDQIALMLLVAMGVLACCCGAGIIGALWAVFG